MTRTLSAIFAAATVLYCISATYMVYTLSASVSEICTKLGGHYSFRGGCEFRSALEVKSRPNVRPRRD